MEFVNKATSPMFFCLAAMLLAYLFALRIRFFSLVDVVWSYLFTPVALVYASMETPLPLRNQIMLIMVTFWSVRLGTHLLLRLKAHYPTEDGRYLDLREKWSKNLKSNFLIFFLFQGFTVPLLSLPFLLIGMNPQPDFHWTEFLGMFVWAIGLAGESLADLQLKNFKADVQNKGKICEVGLWKYSRHPNYFFEWVIWLGYFIFAFTAPFGLIAIISPLLMGILLVKMTGVPYSEAQSLKSRGDAYRDYQRRVSVFIPWFPKK